MTPLKAMTVGINMEDLPEIDQIMWIAKGAKSKSVTESENYLMTRKMVDQIDIIVFNLQEKTELSFTDGVLMQLAFVHIAPIFLVGSASSHSEFLEAMTVRSFKTLDDLVDHLQSHYC